MLRYMALSLFITFLCMYSFKDWYKALCCSLPIIAILERPDAPRNIFGISGFNPYNVVLLAVILGWLSRKQRDDLTWDLSLWVNTLLFVYLLVVMVSFGRMIVDIAPLESHLRYFNLEPVSRGVLVRDDLFNAWKWLIPGLLICYGVTTKERGEFAVQFILITGILLAVQIILKMWPALAGLDDLNTRSLRVLDRDIGYHKGEAGPFMASCAWGCVVYAFSSGSGLKRWLGFFGFALATTALIATASRGGALAWGGCAVVFGLLKWRKILVLGPLFGALAIAFIPGARDRYASGFSSDGTRQSFISEKLGTIDEKGRDLYAITSGRIIVWPRVLERIGEAPFLGYGLRAYERQGIFESLHEDGSLPMGAGFYHHPHNAYFMFMLDMGGVGTVVLLVCLFSLLIKVAVRFSGKNYEAHIDLFSGLLLSFLIVAMLNGLTSGTFYPHQGNVLLFCSIGLFLGASAREDSCDCCELEPIS